MAKVAHDDPLHTVESIYDHHMAHAHAKRMQRRCKRAMGYEGSEGLARIRKDIDKSSQPALVAGKPIHGLCQAYSIVRQHRTLGKGHSTLRHHNMVVPEAHRTTCGATGDRQKLPHDGKIMRFIEPLPTVTAHPKALFINGLRVMHAVRL